MIKVTTEQGKSYEGEFYALDPVTKSLALKGDGDSFMIINTAHIVSMTGNVGTAADVSKFGIKPQSIEQLEIESYLQAEKSLKALNSNVSPEIQALYDRISSIFSICSWADNSVKILDEYVIDPPYDSVRVIQGKDGSGLERISMILQGERRKLNL